MRKGLVALLFLVFASFVAAQALNNDSVIKMVKAGLTDDAIVATINANSGAYDASPDGLIALKQAGVSNKIIDAIVAKSTTSAPDSTQPSAPAPPEPPAQPHFAPLPPGVDNVGAYYKDSGGNWQPLPAEVVIFQSGGLVKHVASAGLMKEDLNGLVGGMRSRHVVSTPVTFILPAPAGHTASDFELHSPPRCLQQPPIPIRRRRPHAGLLQLAARRDRFLQQANRPVRIRNRPQQRTRRWRIWFPRAPGHRR